MSLKHDSAALRCKKVGSMVEVSLVHSGRRGKITVVRPILVGSASHQVHAGVRMVLGAALDRLRIPEEVHAQWLSETSPE
jgi:hypothetical protein